MVYDPSRANDQVLTKLTRSAVRSPFKLTCSAYSPFKCELVSHCEMDVSERSTCNIGHTDIRMDEHRNHKTSLLAR